MSMSLSMTDITRRSLASLARAELTLLKRNKQNMFTVLLAPAVLTIGLQPVFHNLKLPADTLVPTLAATALGFTLIMGVYSTLTATYVTRRDNFVLKRFRTGQASDTVLLSGTAVPVTLTSVAQALLLVIGIGIVSGSAPGNVAVLLIGFVLGIPLMGALAAVTSAWTKTADSVPVAIMPGMMLFMLTSGMLIPFTMLPDVAGDIAQFLPFTPIIELIKHGWSGDVNWAHDLLRMAGLIAWDVVALLGAARYFKWEPRT